MNIVAIIQARTGSKRLPNKVLLTLDDDTVLEQVIDRVKESKQITDVIVATTILKEDLEIVKICANNGIRIYCGSENDVLHRYYQVAKLLNADHIVRITADCPLINPIIIDKVVLSHLTCGRTDYTSNTLIRTFPDGWDVEVMTKNCLWETQKKAKTDFEREHVTPYIESNPDKFKLLNVVQNIDQSHIRLTLDTIEDYEKIRGIYEKGLNKDFGYVPES